MESSLILARVTVSLQHKRYEIRYRYTNIAQQINVILVSKSHIISTKLFRLNYYYTKKC